MTTRNPQPTLLRGAPERRFGAAAATSNGGYAALLTPITNRGADGKFTLPQDGWYHGLPKGEFPNVEQLPDGTVRHAIQVIDDHALWAMKNAFDQESAKPNFAGLLVDFDHFSGEKDKPSEAAGWITAWQNRSSSEGASGAWWQIRWSDIGNDAVVNGRYRFISGEFLPRDCEYIEGPLRNSKTKTITMKVRPLRLASAGLTNKPNLKGMIPLSNREEPGGSPADNQHTKPTMQKIATFVGLSAEASEDAILAELTKLKNRATEAEAGLVPLNSRITALETENKKLLTDQVETDLAPLKNRLTEDEIKPLRDQLLANRTATLPFVTTLVNKLGKAGQASSPSPDKPLTNRNNAKTPGDQAGAGKDDDQLAREREKEVRDYRIKNRCTNAEAWDAVRRDRPELFGITVSN